MPGWASGLPVQVLENSLSQRGRKPGHGGQLDGRGRADARKAPELLEQAAAARGADTGDVQQLRGDGPLRPTLAVVGEAEPVRLVPGALKQPERRAPPREPEAVSTSWHEHLLLPLGQTHDGNPIEPERAGRLHRRVELALPAVDHQEVGQRVAFVSPAGEIAGEHLLDRREVVLLRQTLDLELAIFALLGPARLE